MQYRKKKILVAVILAILIVVITVLIVKKNNYSNNKNNQEVSTSTAQIASSTDDKEKSNNIENGISKEADTNTTINNVGNNNKESNNKENNTNINTISKDNKQEESNSRSTENSNQNAKNGTSQKTVIANTKYYIKVNYQANCVTIYSKDENNNYSNPVKAMVCSCGTATPKSGVFKTSKGYEWGFLEGGTWGRYSTRIVGGILFHSVPYISQSEDSLEYWEYDKLGTTASLGCVRLSVADCKWIFDNCEVGTPVEFYADTDPGPLGKPTAQKISNNIECRDWDPTDSSPNSPWNN